MPVKSEKRHKLWFLSAGSKARLSHHTPRRPPLVGWLSWLAYICKFKCAELSSGTQQPIRGFTEQEIHGRKIKFKAKNIHVNPCRIKEGDHGKSPHSISDGYHITSHHHVLERLAVNSAPLLNVREQGLFLIYYFMNDSRFVFLSSLNGGLRALIGFVQICPVHTHYTNKKDFQGKIFIRPNMFDFYVS